LDFIGFIEPFEMEVLNTMDFNDSFDNKFIRCLSGNPDEFVLK
jgi:hypothetical protein